MASIGDWAIRLTANTSGLTSGLKTAEGASTSFASRIKALGSPLQSLTGIDLTAAAGQFAPLLQGFGLLGKIAATAGASILGAFAGPATNGAVQAAEAVESGLGAAAIGAADATLIVDGFIWRFLKWGRTNPMGNIATTIVGGAADVAGAAPSIDTFGEALGTVALAGQTAMRPIAPLTSGIKSLGSAVTGTFGAMFRSARTMAGFPPSAEVAKNSLGVRDSIRGIGTAAADVTAGVKARFSTLPDVLGNVATSIRGVFSKSFFLPPIPGAAQLTGKVTPSIAAAGTAAAQAAPQVAGLGETIGSVAGFAKMSVLGFVAAAGALVAFGKKGSDAIRELKKMREELEITVEAAQRLKLVGEVGGVDDIKTTLLKFSEHVGDARKELEKGEPSAFASAIRALGLDAKEILALPIDQSFQQIVTELSKIPDGADRASLAYQIFSRDARNLTDLIAKGGSAWETAELRIERFGLAVSELDVSTVSGAVKAMKVAGGAISDTVLSISQRVAVALSPVIKFFSDIVAGIFRILQPIVAFINDIVDIVGDILGGLGDVLAPIIGGLEVILTGFLEAIKSVWDVLKALFLPVFQVLGYVLKGIAYIFTGVLGGALWAIGKVFQAVAWVVSKLADGIKWLWGQLKGFAEWLLSGVLQVATAGLGGSLASLRAQLAAAQATPAPALSAAAMAELTAEIEKQTKKLQEQFSVMGMSAEEAQRFQFAQRGASDEMLRSFDLVVESMALEKKRQDAIKAGADVQTRLNEQIQRHFMSAAALEDMRLQQQGVNAETLEAIRISRDYLAELDAMEKLRERAGQIRSELPRPFGDLKKQIEELQKLFDQDLLSFDEFAAGLSRVMSQADQAREQMVGPRAFEAGTAEAVSAINLAVRDQGREDPQSRIARILEETKKVEEAQLRQDRQLLDAFLNGQLVGTVDF